MAHPEARVQVNEVINFEESLDINQTQIEEVKKKLSQADQQLKHFHTTEDYNVTAKQQEAPVDAKLNMKKEKNKAKKDDLVELIRVENQTWEQ